jgi:hypothetical protein
MNPIIRQPWTAEDLARWGIRSMDDFSAEELARLQEKVEAWVRQRVPHPGSNRRRSSFVMKPRTAAPA